jgi:uncharacterized membrane protein
MFAIASFMFSPITSTALHFDPVSIPGTNLPAAWGINDAGAIVGYDVAGSNLQGFLFSGGVVTALNDPKGSPTLPIAISNRGQIVGEYTLPSGFNRGFSYARGVFTDVGVDTISGANGVNDSGIVVGSYAHCQFCVSHGFIFNGRTYATIDVPHLAQTRIVDINNAGVMAVIGVTGGNVYHAYVYDGKTFTNVDVPGASNTYAEGINDQGDMSLSYLQHGKQLCALLHAGRYTSFTLPNAATSFVGKLNDKRTMIGTGISPGGAYTVYKIKY